MSRAFAALLLGSLALGGCVHAKNEPAGAPAGAIALEAGRVEASWVAGDRMYGAGGSRQLRGTVNWTLIANLAPAAAPDRSGRLLAYSSWRGRGPVLRLLDFRSGADRVLAPGAFGGVWRRDGAIAHFQATMPALRAPRRYVGHVVVRRRPHARPVRWTRRAGRYVAAAWAGDRLLVYRLGSTWPDLLVLDGPGRVRLLGRSTALVAVSPDGREAFIARYGATPPLVRIMSVASGAEHGRLRVPQVRWILETGSWVGERVSAPSSEGPAVFRVRDRTLELERLLRLDPGALPNGLFEPQLDSSGQRIAAWGELVPPPRQAVPAAAVVECELEARRCVSGRRVSSLLGPRLVRDPSRP